MARSKSLTVLIATDGSDEATAAINAIVIFPWPDGTGVHGVVVRAALTAPEIPAHVWQDIERSLAGVAESARKALARRWPDAQVRVVDGPTVDAILKAADRTKARVIVLGSQGHGAIVRLLIGSTSLGVVREMKHAALVVRGRARGVTRIALGFDGSLSARHAVAFLAGLAVPSAGHVTLVSVLDRMAMPSLALLPGSVRAALAAEAAEVAAAQEKKARRDAEPAVAELQRAGFKVDVVLRRGAPLDELLAATEAARAQLLVVGARGHSKIERLLLGSVAEGALHRSPVSVLVTR